MMVTAACGQGDDAADGGPPAAVPAERPAEAAWSYEGETGPENWGDLAADYATCAAGEQQSPIDLKVDAAEQAPGEEVPDVTYDYQSAPYELVDKVHTIQAEVEGEAGGITIGDERYKLVQFHAHAPSEHALDGERPDLEVHLVHQNDDSELAVVGVLIEGDGTGSGLAEAWRELPEGDESVPLSDFDATALLPQDRTLLRYDGSLTTPPCTEGVQWLVMTETVNAPAEVVSAFEQAVGDSARPLQELGDRDVVLRQPEG